MLYSVRSVVVKIAVMVSTADVKHASGTARVVNRLSLVHARTQARAGSVSVFDVGVGFRFFSVIFSVIFQVCFGTVPVSVFVLVHRT